jgi:pyrimidine deaminase RibD-like protein
MRASDFEIHNYAKLDRILSNLCEMVVRGQKSEKDYGMVAAAVIDPDNQIVARLNRPGDDGKRIHAEHAAMEDYKNKYGPIPEGSIVVTTLSPCNAHMDERDGPSCTSIINNSTVKKVYCGYMDPTQDDDTRQFNLMETADRELRTRCKQFADTFLDNVHENFADGRSPGRNSQLNTLHDPQRMASAVAYLTDYYDSKEEAYRIIDAYTSSVDKLITQGGAVYRAVWVAPGQKPKLKQPGLHWTLTPQSAEEYLQSEAGEYAAMDMDLDDQPHAYILSATVGPNNITNHGVNFAQQHHEQEVRIVDPKQAQIKVVKQVGMTENFADGKNPQDKGDSKRHGINTKASVSSLRKTAKQGGRKGQLAHWLANMKSGRAKNK